MVSVNISCIFSVLNLIKALPIYALHEPIHIIVFVCLGLIALCARNHWGLSIIVIYCMNPDSLILLEVFLCCFKQTSLSKVQKLTSGNIKKKEKANIYFVYKFSLSGNIRTIRNICIRPRNMLHWFLSSHRQFLMTFLSVKNKNAVFLMPVWQPIKPKNK